MRVWCLSPCCWKFGCVGGVGCEVLGAGSAVLRSEDWVVGSSFVSGSGSSSE